MIPGPLKRFQLSWVARYGSWVHRFARYLCSPVIGGAIWGLDDDRVLYIIIVGERQPAECFCVSCIRYTAMRLLGIVCVAGVRAINQREQMSRLRYVITTYPSLGKRGYNAVHVLASRLQIPVNHRWYYRVILSLGGEGYEPAVLAIASVPCP